MPRHRKECIPRHRTQPPDENSGRHVPLSAAIEAAGPALDSAPYTAQVDERQPDLAQAETVRFDAVQFDPAQADPAQADLVEPGPTQPDAALPDAAMSDVDAPLASHRRSRPSDSRPARSRRPATGRTGSNQQRRMRGLLVTPWFAAGAGFVIAAALALNSPHAVLTYRPNTSKCSTCTAPGSPENAKPGTVFKPPKPARPAKVGRKSGAARHGAVVAVGPAVDFQVVWSRNGEFAAIVTVPTQQASRGWRLRFEIPGRRIIQVFGAKWRPGPGGHGGVASMFDFQLGPPRHSGRRTHPDGQPKVPGVSGGFGHWGPEQLKFLVTAQGAPVTPAVCVLNGVNCHWG
jgi:hypothetical protein